MTSDVRVLLRRPRSVTSGTRVMEMIFVRDRRVVAVLRDDDPAGRALLRLLRLSREELRQGAVDLDALLVRAQPGVRDVLAAYVEH